MVAPPHNTISVDDDYLIRVMAKRFGLHQGFDPAPLVEMLVKELTHKAIQIQSLFPMKNPLPPHQGRFVSDILAQDTWLLQVDHPSWENNEEASSSIGYRRP